MKTHLLKRNSETLPRVLGYVYNSQEAQTAESTLFKKKKKEKK